MPTKKKRVQVTLSTELEQALTDLQEATGVAPSAFIGQIMEQNLPIIRGLAEAAHEVKKNPASAIKMIQRAMFEALQDASTVQLEMMDAERMLADKAKE